MNPKSEIAQLRKQLERHNRLYYEGQPEISDYEFDQLMRQLLELEAAHPEHFDPNSPSQRVGGAPIEEFKTVLHDPPMLSIDNVYSLDELREWDARVKRGIGLDEFEYEAELKIDGVSIDLLYENGKLTQGATRGDGVRGDDVTPNVRTVRALPLKMDTRFKRVEVRGEIYISKSDFARFNAQLEEAGQEEEVRRRLLERRGEQPQCARPSIGDLLRQEPRGGPSRDEVPRARRGRLFGGLDGGREVPLLLFERGLQCENSGIAGRQAERLREQGFRPRQVLFPHRYDSPVGPPERFLRRQPPQRFEATSGFREIPLLERREPDVFLRLEARDLGYGWSRSR